MELQAWIKAYDVTNAVVLLEGKRNVLPQDVDKLVKLGRLLATSTRNILFRSGNASGADYYFSQGVAAVDNTRLQVITPYTGHRNKLNDAWDTIALDQLDMVAESQAVYFSKQNKKTEKLVDKYVAGDRDRFALKAAYILRDTIKVIGTETIHPASFAIFYDDLSNTRSGGTGHTMHVCDLNKVPWIYQKEWMEWVDIATDQEKKKTE